MTNLILESVRREYLRGDRVVALDDVTVSIPAGQFVAVVGESGGGKSTLLNILGMLDRPDAGKYSVGGKQTSELDAGAYADVRGRTFSYVFQAFHLLERRDALASVELPLLYRGVPAAERRARALAALDTVRMSRFARTPAHLLSGGQRQRVAIARALAAKAPVLLADEPTGSLDSENTREVISSLRKVHESGATVVLVTHSDEVAAAAERRIEIADGRVVKDTQPAPSPEPGVPAEGDPTRRPSALALARDAIANALSRPARTGAMAASIALSIGLLLSTLGLSYSARGQVSELFDAKASSEVTVEWDTQPNEPTVDISRVEVLNGVQHAAHIAIIRSANVQTGASAAPYAALVIRTSGEVVEAARLRVNWAAGANGLEDGTVLVGQSLAGQMQLAAPGMAPSILVNGVPFVVAGVIVDSPRESEWIGAVIMTGDAALVAGDPDTERVLIVAQPGAAVHVSGEIAVAIDPYMPERLRVTHPVDPASVRAEVESSVQSAMVALTAVALIASVATIILTAVSAANERRAEFALRRALGARPRDVWLMLAVESAVPGAMGGVLGVFAGMIAILLVTLSKQWTPVFDTRVAVAALVAGVALALVGAIAGAIRAMRMVPADALRT